MNIRDVAKYLDVSWTFTKDIQKNALQVKRLLQFPLRSTGNPAGEWCDPGNRISADRIANIRIGGVFRVCSARRIPMQDNPECRK